MAPNPQAPIMSSLVRLENAAIAVYRSIRRGEVPKLETIKAAIANVEEAERRFGS